MVDLGGFVGDLEKTPKIALPREPTPGLGETGGDSGGDVRWFWGDFGLIWGWFWGVILERFGDNSEGVSGAVLE